MKSIVSIVGARPQFIKAAPVSAAFQAAGLSEILVHTGQHFDELMSDVFFTELGLSRPGYNLEIHTLGHGAMTGRMLEKIEEVLDAEKPGAVVIYGDTNSTLAGALAASKLRIPIAHVEAGVRSFNRAMPEEINRIVADQLSDALFCPNRLAADNLAAEGVTKGVSVTGDVMKEAAEAAVARGRRQSNILTRLSLKPKTYAVATVHRAGNTDDPERFARIVGWLAARARALPVVIPVHPRAKGRFAAVRVTAASLHLIEPLGYIDMAWLCSNAAEIYTDSGGLQKEAYYYRVPCVTLRDETEWVETIEAGWNRLWTEENYKARRDVAEEGAERPAEAMAEIVKRELL